MGFSKKLSRRQFLINSKRLGNETNSCSPSFVPTTLNPNVSNILHHSLWDLNRTPTPNVFALSEGLNLATNRPKPNGIVNPGRHQSDEYTTPATTMRESNAKHHWSSGVGIYSKSIYFDPIDWFYFLFRISFG